MTYHPPLPRPRGIPEYGTSKGFNQESPGKAKINWSRLGLWVVGGRESDLRGEVGVL